MAPWCSNEDVLSRVSGSDVPPALVTEYAEQATSVLYVLSGRRYSGEASILAHHQINRRGYIRLSEWNPVRLVNSVKIDGQTVAFQVSPAGTYVAVAPHLRGKVASLELEIGQNPPTSGKRAAAALAAEMMRGDPRYAALEANDVRPPMRLTSVTRQGVTYSYADPSTLMEKNLTGVYEVDLFLRAVNPTGARYQPKVV